jgi:hypothetical protein
MRASRWLAWIGISLIAVASGGAVATAGAAGNDQASSTTTVAASSSRPQERPPLPADAPRPRIPSAAETQAADLAPVAPDETSFSYHGGTISADDAASRDLQCFERHSKTTCYDTARELEAAENAALSASAARRVGSKRVRARAANHGGSPMSVYENSGFNSPTSGWRVDAYTSCNWYNLTGGYNDHASSVSTGSHTGLLSIDNDGVGDRLEWSAYTDIAHLTDYSWQHCDWLGCYWDSWNDNASSRYRRGC